MSGAGLQTAEVGPSPARASEPLSTDTLGPEGPAEWQQEEPRRLGVQVVAAFLALPRVPKLSPPAPTPGSSASC